MPIECPVIPPMIAHSSMTFFSFCHCHIYITCLSAHPSILVGRALATIRGANKMAKSRQRDAARSGTGSQTSRSGRSAQLSRKEPKYHRSDLTVRDRPPLLGRFLGRLCRQQSSIKSELIAVDCGIKSCRPSIHLPIYLLYILSCRRYRALHL